MIRKWLTLSNLLSGLLFAVLLVFVLNHKAKALVIRSMMAVGFYQPKLPQPGSKVDADLMMPDLVFQDSNGQDIHLTDLKGKVVFIDLWATWCPYCAAEMPGINELYLKTKANKNIVFIMDDVDSKPDKSLEFMAKRQYSLPVHRLVGVMPFNLTDGTIPATFVVDKNGNIVYRHAGPDDYSNPKMLIYLNELASAQ